MFSSMQSKGFPCSVNIGTNAAHVESLVLYVLALNVLNQMCPILAGVGTIVTVPELFSSVHLGSYFCLKV